MKWTVVLQRVSLPHWFTEFAHEVDSVANGADVAEFALQESGTPMGRNAVSELEHHLGYWLRYVSNHVSHAFMQKIEANGVTVAEWAVLRQMLGIEAQNPSQLADRMGMTRGAISKLIERLCVKGLVERQQSEEDRRYQSVALTSKGAQLVPKLARLADENDQEFFGHLNHDELTQLSRTLQEIVQRHGWKDVPIR